MHETQKQVRPTARRLRKKPAFDARLPRSVLPPASCGSAFGKKARSGVPHAWDQHAAFTRELWHHTTEQVEITHGCISNPRIRSMVSLAQPNAVASSYRCEPRMDVRWIRTPFTYSHGWFCTASDPLHTGLGPAYAGVNLAITVFGGRSRTRDQESRVAVRAFPAQEDRP